MLASCLWRVAVLAGRGACWYVLVACALLNVAGRVGLLLLVVMLGVFSGVGNTYSWKRVGSKPPARGLHGHRGGGGWPHLDRNWAMNLCE